MSCSSVVSAEELTYTLSKLGKSKLILKEEQKLAMFSLFSGRDVFVWLPTRDLGGVSVSKYFRPHKRHTRLDSISKKKKNDPVLYTLLCDVMV